VYRKSSLLVVLIILTSLLTTAHATTRRQRRARTRRSQSSNRVRRVIWHPMFAGSHEMLVRQNQQLDLLELPRIANEEQLLALEAEEELVPVANTRTLTVAANLAPSRRYCRPWTRDFLEDLSEAYYQEFHRPLTVTSLVRTVEQQKKLRRHNSNAGPEEGDTASTHLTGVTVDILKRGMTRKQHDWMNHYFLPLKEAGLIDPIEERRQPVFHVVVFNTYSGGHDGDDSADEDQPETQTAVNRQ